MSWLLWGLLLSAMNGGIARCALNFQLLAFCLIGMVTCGDGQCLHMLSVNHLKCLQALVMEECRCRCCLDSKHIWPQPWRQAWESPAMVMCVFTPLDITTISACCMSGEKLDAIFLIASTSFF